MLGRHSCPSTFLWALSPFTKGKAHFPPHGLWLQWLHCDLNSVQLLLCWTVQGKLLPLQRKQGPLLSEGSKLAGCQHLLHRQPQIKGAQLGRENYVCSDCFSHLSHAHNSPWVIPPISKASPMGKGLAVRIKAPPTDPRLSG